MAVMRSEGDWGRCVWGGSQHQLRGHSLLLAPVLCRNQCDCTDLGQAWSGQPQHTVGITHFPPWVICFPCCSKDQAPACLGHTSLVCPEASKQLSLPSSSRLWTRPPRLSLPPLPGWGSLWPRR